MASESPANAPGTPATKQSLAGPSTSPTGQPNGDEAGSSQAAQSPQGQQFYFNGEPPHDGSTAEPDGGLPASYHDMPVLPYTADPMTRPKRTQCKNACTNCQKACKKCDDNRPCHRCIRYGSTDTCVDSKRKERKKGIKRGPYKKRDKGRATDAGDDGSDPSSANSAQGPSPNMPYVGPVGYPPGMWSNYPPGGPGVKIEGGGFYQPVYALTPVAGQGPQGADSGNAGPGAGGEGPPHFPVGFYPAAFVSYPGPYPPFPMPAGGIMPPGFHYAYPPPPGVYPPRPPNTTANSPNGKPDVVGSGSGDLRNNKNTPDSGAAADVEKSDPKDPATESQVNAKAKIAETHANGAVDKDGE